MDAVPGLAALGVPDGSLGLLHARIGDPPVPVAELESLLSAGERAAAARLVRRDDRLRSVTARGLVRVLLARCLAREPGGLRIERDEYGKPFMEGGPSFNVAHSGPSVAIVIGARGRLGIDVEARRSIPEMESLVRRYFSPDEVSAWCALPAPEQEVAFFRVWTRKEAFIKAVGKGLSYPLDAFSVSVEGTTASALQAIEDPSSRDVDWCIRSVGLDPAVEAAVANDQGLVRLHRISLRDRASGR